ncbi:uncharacterized protein LOC105846487 isoform X2 [Hydra vulgaris]|uniref:uncharacterized protein LOC105846487 isoform X2 n=2 Tax=Hydra vulgaris TaxID=6087 RepID=UPI001F5E7117|nr:uncharacterized protein LOC105846487 isoform X2 [Hydra vulgaris]
MKTILLLICFFRAARSGTNDFCPGLTQACPTFASIPYYPFLPSWSFLFEENPLIYNAGIEGSLAFTLNSGKIMLMPERRGSVVFCDAVAICLNTYIYTGLPDQTCVSDLTKCSSGGFTFSLWVKIGVNEKARLTKNAPTNTTTFINFPGQGMSIKYDHYLENWQVVARQGTFSGVVQFSGNNAERWHHIVGIAYSSLYVSAFLDGQFMGNQTMDTVSGNAWPATAATLFKGGENPANGRFWIDDFKMWATPLSASQIQENYIDDFIDFDDFQDKLEQ